MFDRLVADVAGVADVWLEEARPHHVVVAVAVALPLLAVLGAVGGGDARHAVRQVVFGGEGEDAGGAVEVAELDGLRHARRKLERREADRAHRVAPVVAEVEAERAHRRHAATVAR